VHGRTKSQGYRPPAFWDRIGLIRKAITLPVIANGEIWNAEDAHRCLQESGCDALMLGRGAVSDPFLAQRLRGVAGQDGWPQVLQQLKLFITELDGSGSDSQVSGRVKQWLNYLRRDCSEAEVLYQQMVRLRRPAEMLALL
jgi:tRNA-dihydrouridine synthase C